MPIDPKCDPRGGSIDGKDITSISMPNAAHDPFDIKITMKNGCSYKTRFPLLTPALQKSTFQVIKRGRDYLHVVPEE